MAGANGAGDTMCFSGADGTARGEIRVPGGAKIDEQGRGEFERPSEKDWVIDCSCLFSQRREEETQRETGRSCGAATNARGRKIGSSGELKTGRR